LLVLFTFYCFSIMSLVENKRYLLVKHQHNGDISGTDYLQSQTNAGNPVSNAVSNQSEKARQKSKARSSIGHKGVAHLRNRPCKDDSHLCMTISSLLTCTVKISTKTFADVCKRTCGICNDNQLPLPSPKLPSPKSPQLPLPRPPQSPSGEYSFIGEGFCQLESGEIPYQCCLDDVSSQILCENHCSSWSSCIAYDYFITDEKECCLLPLERSCPSGFDVRFASEPTAARSELRSDSKPNYGCYEQA